MPHRKFSSVQTVAVLDAFFDRDSLDWRTLYGYAVVNETGLLQGTVYQILKRLERAGFLEAHWDLSPTGKGPPRRVYELTASGRELLIKRRRERRNLSGP